jgi:hypothetical protein
MHKVRRFPMLGFVFVLGVGIGRPSTAFGQAKRIASGSGQGGIQVFGGGGGQGGGGFSGGGG